MLIGYLIALAVSAAVIVFQILAFVFLDFSPASIDLFTSSLLQFYLVAIVYLGIFAFPGWLLMATIAKWQGAERKLWFVLGGAFVGLTAVILETTTMMGGFFYDFPKEMLLVPLIGGLVGGIAYWAVVGKHSGTWKATTKSESA
jgi:hypothetical protein